MPSNVPTTEPVKVVTDACEVAYVYCGRAHIFEECSTNLVYVNYVGNKKYNYPYNPALLNHPNLSWSNNQNQLKSQASQIPRSFSTHNDVVATHVNKQL